MRALGLHSLHQIFLSWLQVGNTQFHRCLVSMCEPSLVFRLHEFHYSKSLFAPICRSKARDEIRTE